MARPPLPLALVLSGLAACAGESSPEPVVETSGIDEYIAGIAELAVKTPSVAEGERSQPAREGDYQCTTQNLQETRQYDKLVALSANSESLWPGAIIAGDS